jgi:hypothetical protein
MVFELVGKGISLMVWDARSGTAFLPRNSVASPDRRSTEFAGI